MRGLKLYDDDGRNFFLPYFLPIYVKAAVKRLEQLTTQTKKKNNNTKKSPMIGIIITNQMFLRINNLAFLWAK